MIDRNCFPIYEGKCVSYGGRLYPETVKYTLDDSIDDAIDKLTSYVLKKLEETSTGTDSIDFSGFNSGYSTCVSKIIDRDINFEVSLTGNGGNFTFNYSSITENLPSGFNVVNTKTSIITSDGDSTTLKDAIGGVSFAPYAYPLNVDFEAVVTSECGLIKMNRSLQVGLGNKSTQLPLVVHDFGVDLSAPKTSKEAIEFLMNSVSELSSKIDARLSLGGGKSISDVVNNLAIEQKVTEGRIDDIPSNTEDNIKDLNSRVTTLEKSVNEIKPIIREIKTQLDQIQKDLTNK